MRRDAAWSSTVAALAAASAISAVTARHAAAMAVAATLATCSCSIAALRRWNDWMWRALHTTSRRLTARWRRAAA